LFDKLIDAVMQFGARLRCCTVIESYESGVIMRLGNCRKVVTSENGLFGTGLHPMWPFIETDLTEPIKPRVVSFSGRSLMTKDGKNVVVGVTMTLRVADPKKALLEVHDADNCIDDIGQLVTARTIQQFNYVDLTSELFEKELLSNARERGDMFGIDVMDIGLGEIAIGRTIRLVEGK
jgi:regulator of protease activity HflC (stomatin/prohibitin superfamily)